MTVRQQNDKEVAPQGATVLATLVAARKLLAAGWCQGSGARDVRDMAVPVRSEHAKSFCATGALHRVLVLDHMLLGAGPCMLLLQAITHNPVLTDRCTGSAYSSRIQLHNDRCLPHGQKGQQAALAWFDRAIKLAKPPAPARRQKEKK